MKSLLFISALVGLISADYAAYKPEVKTMKKVVYQAKKSEKTEKKVYKPEKSIVKSYHKSESNSYGHSSATSHSDDRCSPMCEQCHGFNHCKVCAKGWQIVHSADAQWCSREVSNSQVCSPMCKQCHGFNHCKVCAKGWQIVHSADAQWCSPIDSHHDSYSAQKSDSYSTKKSDSYSMKKSDSYSMKKSEKKIEYKPVYIIEKKSEPKKMPVYKAPIKY